ncbi:MAG: metalloregulator ArsR/SmtB family transcription factor [bacterium]|mgnify:CR=1 FL=1|nr:metalloregulator ArsR/SmtB family transcription factor [bacterium]
MEKELKVIKALGQETRFRIVHILVKSGRGLCICEIMDALKKPEYDVSRSLNILKNAGLIKSTRKGKVKLFEIRSETEFENNTKRMFKNINPEKGSVLKRDLELLEKRLKLRINDCCVVTYQKEK